MKVAAALLSAFLASSSALSLFGGGSPDAISATGDSKVPGESPLEYCTGQETKEYVEINSVDLVPNPPAAYV